MGMGYCQGQRAESNCLEIVVPYIIDRSLDEKRCYRCREWYPANTDWFHSNVSRYDKLSNQCKKCNDFTRKERRLNK